MEKHFSNEEIAPEAFLRDVYANKDRWVSYYHQIKLVKNCIQSGSVLVVGVGDGVVVEYLKGLFEVKTVDIIPSLKPDFVASVDDMNNLPDNSFDVVLCAEVLEHLPYEKFNKCLSELKRVSKRHVVISLPYWGYTFGLRLRFPVLGLMTFKLKLSGLKKHITGRQHFWEIGKKGFPLRMIKSSLRAAGFVIQKSFWDLDDPYHYYFVLGK